jgi:flagellar hook-length control protein FliK
MDTSNRIDTSTSFALELRTRRQNAMDDGAQDLFAQALGQQLAKNQDENSARYSVTKSRPALAGDDAAEKSRTAESQPARATRPTGTGAAHPISHEAVSGKKSASPQTPPPKPNARTGANPKPAPSGSAQTAKPKSTSDEGGKSVVSTPATASTAEPADTDATTTAATADTTTDEDGAEDKTGLEEKDAATAVPAPAEPATAMAPAPPPAAAVIPVVQAAVLLLSGVAAPNEDAATEQAASDPQALPALLSKLQAAGVSAAAGPKPAAADATPQQNDPNAIGDDSQQQQRIDLTKPAEPMSTDRAPVAATKPKAKTAAQDNTITAQSDVSSKPILPQQAALAVLAQADTGSGRGTTLPEGMRVNDEGEVGASDLEFSAWSEQLGPGLANGAPRLANWQQSAFLAQLKQNVQMMPPHEQVAVQIQRAAQNGIGRLTVDLQPAELGRVEIKMNVDKDKNVTASVVVDRPATLDLLQRDARSLERILQDSGLQTGSGSLSFSLRNSGGDAQGQNQGRRSGAGKRGETGNDAGAVAAPTVRPTMVATADGYVDLET